jgi:hypothetical protein
MQVPKLTAFIDTAFGGLKQLVGRVAPGLVTTLDSARQKVDAEVTSIAAKLPDHLDAGTVIDAAFSAATVALPAAKDDIEKLRIAAHGLFTPMPPVTP